VTAQAMLVMLMMMGMAFQIPQKPQMTETGMVFQTLETSTRTGTAYPTTQKALRIRTMTEYQII
jgi:hypothetical protein